MGAFTRVSPPGMKFVCGYRKKTSGSTSAPSLRARSLALFEPGMLIRLSSPPPKKKRSISPPLEWVTGISIQPNWVVESPLWLPASLSLLVINSNTLSGFVSYTFVSIKEPVPDAVLAASFLPRILLHFRVRAGTLWSLTTEYLLTRGVITAPVWLQLIAQAVSEAVTQQSHSYNLACAEIALNCTIISITGSPRHHCSTYPDAT